MMGIPRLYALIGAGVVVALFLAWVWRLDTLRARHLKEAQTAELKLTISNTSLNQCNGHLADNNRRVSEANAALVRHQSEANAALARADARWETQKGRVSDLEASARRTDLPACQVSQTALQGLAGL